ncbi:cation-translocating P-type ATPase [Usitatibacter palustris]|uniref:cation-translocating P-type ATPase n=1 Tax=Usitatibacter palustris TaxID=2732487 RepID=UPI001FE5BE37|nr:cation-translocating P-type ATPase [Usitatibacter palustris]
MGKRGLTSAEAATRLAADGPNALPTRESRGLIAFTFQVMREPTFVLLVSAALVYLVLGDLREALVLAASVLVIVAITVVQERRTERALEALRDLSSPRALVIRDGREQRIAGAQVVRGDLLMLREGDRVPADARLIEANDFMVDESLLTGEAVPVAKRAHPHEGLEVQAFSGTLVVRGTALGEVVATGPRSELGRIGSLLHGRESPRTALEVETARVVRLIAIGALVLCVLMAVIFTAMRGDALGGVLAGLTLAMALLPEEFPVVLTVFLALGAWRISRHGVLTRRMPAIETLGAATVLCCDKTGTLTENRMTVVETWREGRWRTTADRDADDAALLRAAALACEPSPFDPMERAIHVTAPGAHERAGVLERRYPLAEGFLAVCHAWLPVEGDAHAAIKGAPETVLDLCALEPAARAAASAAAERAAARGLRLLGVAAAPWTHAPWPAAANGFAFRFLGFVALADPLRPAVPGAIALCRKAGIRVVMITGDHPATAAAIARAAGIDATRIVTGAEIGGLDDAALAQCVAATQIFARVRPEQKLRLVEALRRNGEVVVMTGDGVNDAPALRAADIGIAMGARGTDVAREAAALVLLDDDFTSIVGAVRLGRRIYDNIRYAMRFLVAVHVPLAGMSFVPLFAGWPLLVFPVHVVFLEFVIDPTCSVVFEAERGDAGIMDRPPRRRGERLFTARIVAVGLALGASVLAAVTAVYGLALAQGLPEGEARALGFAALVAGDVALIFANRSGEHGFVARFTRDNPALWWVVGITLGALVLCVYAPSVASLFRFMPPAPGAFAVAVAAGFASVLWYEVVRAVRRN